MTITQEPAVTRESATQCPHERGHITDSHFFGDRYATKDTRRIFCDRCRNQRWLDIEAALALAQAELGMIPAHVATRIAASAKVDLIDLAQVRAEMERSGHSLVGLLRVFQRACGDEAGQFIHYGATTQDIQDTGQVLEIRDVLDALAPMLDGVIVRVAELAEQHATTIALGRTHAQPALPMAFGLKLAGWADELLRHRDRIAETRPRVLVAQLFGGTGTMAGFADKGPALLVRFADRLGLGVPTIGWHAARDRVAEFVGLLAMITATMARIADEIRLLSRPEFGEVEEAWRPGKVGSSTMPHKRNPERAEQVVVMARLAAAQAGLALTAMVGDHERDSRSLRIEWACLPDAAHYCLTATSILRELVNGLKVHTDRLAANVAEVAEQVMSERLMLALGEHVGKQRAHEIVYDLTQHARQENLPVRELVAGRRWIAELLPAARQAEIFEPAGYLGTSTELTCRVVAEVHKRLGPPAGQARP